MIVDQLNLPMYLEPLFDEAPAHETCRKVKKFVAAIRNPAPEDLHDLENIRDHWEFRLAELPPELKRVLNSGDSVLSGWINEIECFWVAQARRLFLFDSALVTYFEATVSAPVVAVGFVNGMVVVSHEDSIALFTRELTPVENTFHLPTNVIVTVIENDIAGCNDGSLRRITVNPRSAFVRVSGCLTLFPDDPITTIVELRNKYVTLSLNNVLSVFEKSLTNVSSKQLKAIAGLWTTDGTCAYVMDKSANLSKVVIDGGSLEVQPVGQMMRRKQFHSVSWKHGFLTAIDRTRLSYDQVTLARFVPYAICASTCNLGVVYTVGSTPDMMTAVASSGVYQFFEKLESSEDEQVWGFARCIERFWDMTVSELVNETTLIKKMEDLFKSSYQKMSDLCKYVLTILDDYQVIGADYQKEFASEAISHFFERERAEQFSKLRKLAFEFRLNQEVETPTDPWQMTKLEQMIALANHGSERQVKEVLAMITSSFDELPSCFRQCCDFLMQHEFYMELIQSVCKWANSVQPDAIALAYENAGCPTCGIDEATSYHLRCRIYHQLEPLFAMAIRRHDTEAGYAVKTALRYNNTVFQRFVLQYLEDHCTADLIKHFEYPEMIDQMKMINSKYLVDMLIYKGRTSEALEQLLDKASSLAIPYSVEERLGFLRCAAGLAKSDKELQTKIENMLKAGELLEPFIRDTPECPKDLFCRDICEIINFLVDWGDYLLALRVMNIFGEKRDDVLMEFLDRAEPSAITAYIGERGVYTEDEVAQAIFERHGTEALSILKQCSFSTTCIFNLIITHLKMPDYIANAEILLDLLYNGENVDYEIREKVATLYCNVILNLSVQDDDTLRAYAERMRAGLGRYFLENSFTDVWDTL